MSHDNVPDIPLSRIVAWTVGVALVTGAFWLLFRFQNAVLLFLTAIMLSFALRPGVAFLERRGIPRPSGILLILLTIGLLLGLLVYLALPLLAEQGTTVQSSLADGYRFIRDALEQLPNILVRRLLAILPAELTMAGGESVAATPAESDAGMAQMMAQARPLLLGLFYLLALGILTFFWLLEGEYIKRAAFLLIPLTHRGDIQQLVQEIESKVSGYMLGQGLLCLIIGALAFVAYLIIGLPNALLLALFAGLLEAVPVVGPFLGALPAIVVALSISPLAAFWVLLATVIIQQVEGSVLVPRVMRRAIGVRPLVTLLALLTFGSLFGILGAIIALPLAAVIQTFLDRYLLSGDPAGRATMGRDRLSVLRYEADQLIQDVRGQVRNKESEASVEADALEDELEALAVDLESYLAMQGAVE